MVLIVNMSIEDRDILVQILDAVNVPLRTAKKIIVIQQALIDAKVEEKVK